MTLFPTHVEKFQFRSIVACALKLLPIRLKCKSHQIVPVSKIKYCKRLQSWHW